MSSSRRRRHWTSRGRSAAPSASLPRPCAGDAASASTGVDPLATNAGRPRPDRVGAGVRGLRHRRADGPARRRRVAGTHRRPDRRLGVGAGRVASPRGARRQRSASSPSRPRRAPSARPCTWPTAASWSGPRCGSTRRAPAGRRRSARCSWCATARRRWPTDESAFFEDYASLVALALRQSRLHAESAGRLRGDDVLPQPRGARPARSAHRALRVRRPAPRRHVRRRSAGLAEADGDDRRQAARDPPPRRRHPARRAPGERRRAGEPGDARPQRRHRARRGAQRGARGAGWGPRRGGASTPSRWR